MKRLTFISVALIFCFSSFSQPVWEMIYGSDSTSRIKNVFMTDAGHTWGNSGGSIYFSPDQGHNWTRQFHHEDYGFSDIFFLDSLTGWFAGWQEVLKTTDGGQNWTLQDLPNQYGMDIEAVYFINQDTGWISASYKMIYVTYDGGENWLLQHNTVFTDHYFLYDIHFWDSQHGCTVGGMLIYPNESIIMTTNDGGENWTEILDIGTTEFVKVEFTNDSTVWAVNRDGFLYKSIDGGFNWEYTQSWPHFYPSDMHFFNEDTAIILNHWTFYRTRNEWVDYNYTDLTMQNALSNFSFYDDLHGIAVGGTNIMLTSDGGYNWERINERFYRIGFFDHENGWILQEPMDKDVMHSADGGYTWSEVDLNQTGRLYELSFPTESCGYIISDKMELIKTTDAGQNWEIMNLDFDSTYFREMQFISQDTGFMCGGIDRFYRTYNGGEDWEEFQIINSSSVTDIYFINGQEGWLTISDSVCGHTIDGGASWDYTRVPSDRLYLVYFYDKNLGFIHCLNSDMYQSSDGGKTWHLVHQQFSYPADIVMTDSLCGWMTSKTRVYRTTNGGYSWTEYFRPLSKNDMWDISDLCSIDSSHIWFSTMDGRVFALSLEMGNDEISGSKGIKIYPNPVSNILTLELSSINNDDISLMIFSLDGRLLLSKEFLPKDNSEIKIDVSGFLPGVYIVRVSGLHVSHNLKFIKS